MSLTTLTTPITRPAAVAWEITRVVLDADTRTVGITVTYYDAQGRGIGSRRVRESIDGVQEAAAFRQWMVGRLMQLGAIN